MQDRPQSQSDSDRALVIDLGGEPPGPRDDSEHLLLPHMFRASPKIHPPPTSAATGFNQPSSVAYHRPRGFLAARGSRAAIAALLLTSLLALIVLIAGSLPVTRAGGAPRASSSASPSNAGADVRNAVCSWLPFHLTPPSSLALGEAAHVKPGPLVQLDPGSSEVNFLSPLALPPAEAQLSATTKLVVVPGHAVFTGRDAAKWRDSRLWALEPFQRGNGDFLIECFARHIKRALQLFAADPDHTLLVFSGGQSRRRTGPRSEGMSYYVVMEEAQFFGILPSELPDQLADRIVAEEFARDSYENILFSIARFREMTGRFPDEISVVGWRYKKPRFTLLHRAALRFPARSFNYIGMDMDDIAAAIVLEQKERRARDERSGTVVSTVADASNYNLGNVIGKRYSDQVTFDRDKMDLYLCHVNAATRSKRNPMRRAVPYFVTCPELVSLLAFCGPHLIDPSVVPWGRQLTAQEAAADDALVAQLQRAERQQPQQPALPTG